MLLAVEDVHVSLGGREVLRGLTLAVEPGDIYGYLGRNGAGKTTTLKAVLGLLPLRRGRIVVAGEPVRGQASIRRRIGYMSQEQNFYEWMDARALGRFVGAFYPAWDPPFFTHLLTLLRVDPKTPSGALSTGTRRKLALALALAARPPLLLLDEPTAGVDPVTRVELLEVLAEQVRVGDHAVVFSTHYIAEIEALASRVGVLRGGRLFYEGTPEGLCTRARWAAGQVPEAATVLQAGPRGTLLWAEPERWEGIADTRAATLEEAFVGIARGESSA